MTHSRHDCVAWNSWWMAPGYGATKTHWGMPQHVYAPSLMEAFTLARCKWPSAQAWQCLGRVDPADPELSLGEGS